MHSLALRLCGLLVAGVLVGTAGALSPGSAVADGPPTLAAAFAPATVPAGGTSALTFTIATAPGSQATGLHFDAMLPTGLDVTGATGSACGGTLSTHAAYRGPPGPVGQASINLTDATVAAGAVCQFTVPVIAAAPGSYAVTTGLGAVAGDASTTATLAVTPTALAPAVSATFSPRAIAVGRSSSLTLKITNPNRATSLTDLSFYTPFTSSPNPILPSRVVANTCGGSIISAPHEGVVLPPYLSLGQGFLASRATCAVTVQMTGEQPGDGSFWISVDSAQGGPSLTLAALSILASPPRLSLRFAPSRVSVSQASRLTLSITNQPVLALTHVAFLNTLPRGVRVASPARRQGSCGGRVSAAAGSPVVGLIKGKIAAGATCKISVAVRAIQPGRWRDSTGPVTSSEAADAGAVTASLHVRRRRNRWIPTSAQAESAAGFWRVESGFGP